MIAQLLLLTKKSLPRVRALADIQVSTITIGWNNVDWQSCTRAIRYTHTRDYTFVQKSQDTFRSFVDNEIFEPYTCFIVELLIYIYQNFAGFFAAKISNFETNTYHLRLLSMYLHPWILFLFRLRIFWSFSFFLLFFLTLARVIRYPLLYSVLERTWRNQFRFIYGKIQILKLQQIRATSELSLRKIIFKRSDCFLKGSDLIRKQKWKADLRIRLWMFVCT